MRILTVQVTAEATFIEDRIEFLPYIKALFQAEKTNKQKRHLHITTKKTLCGAA